MLIPIFYWQNITESNIKKPTCEEYRIYFDDLISRKVSDQVSEKEAINEVDIFVVLRKTKINIMGVMRSQKWELKLPFLLMIF
uniref:Uncharacterized protein n=1 Tax=Acinetobacter baumannii TaxID=470 RepID=A0A125S0T9_ACIBA|nr:hypothetical protein [Acinetobacter baumannii]AMD83625.1 hypothetical protein [Acinetobacter baumannii]